MAGIRENDRAGEIERNRFVRERSFFAVEINRHQDPLAKFSVPPDAADKRPFRFEASAAIREDFGYDPGKPGDTAFPIPWNEFEDQLICGKAEESARLFCQDGPRFASFALRDRVADGNEIAVLNRLRDRKSVV